MALCRLGARLRLPGCRGGSSLLGDQGGVTGVARLWKTGPVSSAVEGSIGGGRMGGQSGSSVLGSGPLDLQVRGVSSKHKKIRKMAKGYRGRGKNCFRIAVQRVYKALEHGYRHRKTKKREIRTLWIERINAGTRQHDFSYARMICGMSKANIELNRKVLSDLAVTEPLSFLSVVRTVKSVYNPPVGRSLEEEQEQEEEGEHGEGGGMDLRRGQEQGMSAS